MKRVLFSFFCEFAITRPDVVSNTRQVLKDVKDFAHEWMEDYADFVPTHLLTVDIIPPSQNITLFEEVSFTGTKERIFKGAFNNLISNSEGLNV